MKTLHYPDIMPIITQRLASGGIFLTAGADAPNTMTIGWAFMGYSWRKHIFVAMVRPSRHTYGLLKARGEFTISIPGEDNRLSEALGICGTLSGKDMNKWECAGLTPLKGRTINTPVVAECGYHVELKTLDTTVLDVAAMDQVARMAAYPNDDVHTLFFGEVVDCYGI